MARPWCKVRKNKSNGWLEYDIQWVWPNGEHARERRQCPKQTPGAADEYAKQRERDEYAKGPPSTRAQVVRTKWDEFWPHFKRLHFELGPRGALKPSQQASIESHWEHHIQPFWGWRAFHDTAALLIDEWIAGLQAPCEIRGKKATRTANTINKISITFNTMLNRAEKWGYAPRDLPRAQTLRIAKPEIDFYTRADFDVLAEAAKRAGPDVDMVIQLGARAGLRAGEIAGVRPGDVAADRNELLVQRSIWKGKMHAPKSGKPRRVPIAPELAAAIRERPSGYVLNDDGAPLTGRQLQHLVKRAERAAGFPSTGRVHKLRHTYASHLVMIGVPLKVVQELLGHADIATTMRYAHLAPGALEDAVAKLAGEGPERIENAKNLPAKVG